MRWLNEEAKAAYDLWIKMAEDVFSAVKVKLDGGDQTALLVSAAVSIREQDRLIREARMTANAYFAEAAKIASAYSMPEPFVITKDALGMMQKAKAMMRADEIAAEAHAGQFDKGGSPYIEHPRRVSAAVTTMPEKIVALLHDVVEDCPGWTLDRLRAEGFDGEIIEAVDAMTKRKGEDYFAAILRARANTIARVVKLADLADNSDRSRLKHITEADERRLDKYARATLMLRESCQVSNSTGVDTEAPGSYQKPRSL